MNPWRQGALILVIAVAAANAVHLALTVPPPPADSPAMTVDPVTRHERRFDALRRSLRARGLQGTLGYISGRPRRSWDAELLETEGYYLMQFALAPLILDPEPARYEWAVTNLPATDQRAQVPEGWQITQDFGAGVLLLHKEHP